MENGHRRSLVSPAPSKVELGFKLRNLVIRHEKMKVAYHQLKSEIDSGLLQAEEVFASLAIPLMKLVGLKTVEMAGEGRFTTVIISSDYSDGSQRNEVLARRREQDHLTGVFEGEGYLNMASKAGKELREKQQVKLIQLVHLLRQIESQVNSHQDNILHTLDNHRISLHRLFQKAIYFVCAVHSQNHNTFMITMKLLEAIYKNISTVLGIVEDGVQDLMKDLAEEMCNPMVEYVKGLEDDMKNGTCVHLLTIVQEMEKMMKDGRLELEDARKKVQMAEEGKTQALSKLEAAEEREKRMLEHIRCLPGSKRGKLEESFPDKLLGMGEGQGNDGKLLWQMLKKRRKYQAPESPMGLRDLHYFNAIKEHHNTNGERPSIGQRPIKMNTTRVLSPQTPCLRTLIPLGTSPSAPT